MTGSLRDSRKPIFIHAKCQLLHILKLGQDITVTLKGSVVKSEMGDNQDGKVNLNSEAIRKQCLAK